MPIDRFANSGDSTAAPSTAPFIVIPRDTNELPEVPKRLYVGAGGSVTLRGVGGAAM